MTLKESIDFIQDEIAKAVDIIQKSEYINHDLNSKKDELDDREIAIAQRESDYRMTPKEFNNRVDDLNIKSAKLQEIAIKIEGDRSQLEEEKLLFKKDREDIDARFKDVEIMKEDIRNRELACIEREKIVADKLQKISELNLV